MPQFLKEIILDHLQGLLIEQFIAFITAVGIGKWLYNKIDEWLTVNWIYKAEEKRRRRRRMGLIK